MIFDQLNRAGDFLVGGVWDEAFAFISTLDANAEAKRYELSGSDLVAVVESYRTKDIMSAYPESHRRYIDIQVLLSGTEEIQWWPTDSLAVREAYDSERDIAFYERPDHGDAAITLLPGRFALFSPQDAHMPGLQKTFGPSVVKKVVVKVAVSLLQG